MLTAYLFGMLVSLLLLLCLWAKIKTEVGLLGIICGILSCTASWIAVLVFVYLLCKM